MADTNPNVIIPTANVEGNITSCKIEQQHLRTDKSSLFAVSEVKTYATYDVCSKKIIDQYTVPEFAGFGEILIVASLLVVVTVTFIISVFLGDSSY